MYLLMIFICNFTRDLMLATWNRKCPILTVKIKFNLMFAVHDWLAISFTLPNRLRIRWRFSNWKLLVSRHCGTFKQQLKPNWPTKYVERKKQKKKREETINRKKIWWMRFQEHEFTEGVKIFIQALLVVCHKVRTTKHNYVSYKMYKLFSWINALDQKNNNILELNDISRVFYVECHESCSW